MDTNNRLRAIWHGLARSGRYTKFVDDSDYKTFDRRIANEGAEFFARGFTSLRASLLEGLEKGSYNMDPTIRFKTRRGTRLPAFLYRAWSRIFDDCGRMHGIVNVDAVSCLNQLLAVFGKIEGGHTKESESSVISEFIKNEAIIGEFNHLLASDKDYILADRSVNLPSPLDRFHYRLQHIGWEHLLDIASCPDIDSPNREQIWDAGRIDSDYRFLFILEARRLVRRVLMDENPLDIHPKHGSGVSACQTPVHHRYDMPRYVERLDRIYPYTEYFFLNSTHLCDTMSGRVSVPGMPSTHRWLEDMPSYEPCAKVLLVPKDARGPRLISCEPRETMWLQQGLLSKLVTCLEAHPLTRGLVNFTDQSINKYQAYLGSITGDTATLDLKDASDRVPWQLIKMIYPRNWVDALDATRSRFTQLPDGTTVELEKFAPMGSALCFPIMALTIWALLTAAANAAQTARAVRVSGKLARNNQKFAWKDPVYVYGDDIVVPVDFATPAKLVLESVGLKVNTRKCFVRSSFRESCGGEYYNGHDITPVRLRSLPTDDVPSRMRVIAFHNNVFSATGTQPIWLTELIHEWYPHVPERSAGYHNISRETLEVLPHTFPMMRILNAHQVSSDNGLQTGILDVHQPDNSHLPRRFRKALQRTEYRYLTVVPRGIKYPKDRWSQVFRAVVNPRLDSILGWDALAKRVSYKYRWTPLR